MTNLQNTRFFIKLYIIFVLLLIAFDVNRNTDLGIPELPTLQFSSIIGDSLNDTILSLQEANPIFWVVGTLIQVGAILIAIVIYFLNLLFFLLQLLTFFVKGQPFINSILLITRVLFIVEIIPYVKNAVHPTIQGTS